MNYRKLLSLSLCIFIFLLPYRLLAWGHAVHAMIAELAMGMLTDATRVKVERVLNGMTAAEAGNWMDEVRSDPKYKYTAPWHYVNIEPIEAGKTQQDEKLNDPQKGPFAFHANLRSTGNQIRM